MARKLTHKQRLWVREYLSNGFNGSQAVRVAYPNIKTRGAIDVMAHKLVRNNKIKSEIQQIKEDILDQKTDIARNALGNLLRIQGIFENKNKLTNDDIRTMEKNARTILEWAGHLGGKSHANTAIQVNIGSNGFDLDKMGTFQLVELKKQVESALQSKDVSFNDDDITLLSQEDTIIPLSDLK